PPRKSKWPVRPLARIQGKQVTSKNCRARRPDRIGSGIWTPVESTGLPKPETQEPRETPWVLKIRGKNEEQAGLTTSPTVAWCTKAASRVTVAETVVAARTRRRLGLAGAGGI